MAYTFLAAQGVDVGASRMEDEDELATARKALERGRARVRVLLPVDVVVAAASTPRRRRGPWPPTPSPPAGWRLDIGPRTVELYAGGIGAAKTIFWNGPMGVFEMAPFARGTLAVAEAVAGCGGAPPSSAAATRWPPSTWPAWPTASATCPPAGAPSLEFLEGKVLPGVAALEGAPMSEPPRRSSPATGRCTRRRRRRRRSWSG